MPTLYVLIGCPASGKSTWAKNMIKQFPPNSIVHISRDEIRFALLQDGEPYFSYEDIVYAKYIEKIAENLNANKSVIADATHLNYNSRQKLFREIKKHIPNKDFKELKKIAICFSLPYKVCYDRNKARTGLARVPDAEFSRMYHSVKFPTFDVDEGFNDILYYKEKK